MATPPSPEEEDFIQEKRRRKKGLEVADRSRRLDSQDKTISAEQEKLERLEESGWWAISDPQLTSVSPIIEATLSDSSPRGLLAAIPFLDLVFGTWLETQVLPYLNRSLKSRRPSIANANKKYYNRASRRELLAYFLRTCLGSMIHHQKHSLKSSALEVERKRLCGIHRTEAIHACLGFEDHILEVVLASWAPHICGFVAPGSLCCVDETIFPHYGKQVFDQGKLIYIPGKPWPYGLLTYVLCQRLRFTRYPVCISLRANFLGTSLTPKDIALALLGDLQRASPAGPVPQQMVADKLWSPPASIDSLVYHGKLFCVSTDPTNTRLPPDLVSVAASDLPIGCSRTYTNGALVLQVTAEADRNAVVLSNMWTLRDSGPAPQRTSGAYATAVSLFEKETVGSLVALFDLGPEWHGRTKAEIIHHRTGWDPLRSLEAQGSSEPLTFAAASKMKKKQLTTIHQSLLKLPRPSKKTKRDMLAELFPQEVQVDEAAAAAEQERRKQKRRRDVMQNLHAHRENVRGCHSQEGTLHDLFDSQYNIIDRLNEDYHMHFQQTGFQTAHSLAVHSALFYFLLTVHSLWEEHRVAYEFNHSRGSKEAALKVHPYSIPNFVYKCARALSPVK